MMDGTIRRAGALAAVVSLAVLLGVRAEDAKSDDAKAEDFKSKDFVLKANEKGKVALIFPAGKTFAVTVRSKKETDVNLFIYDADKKVVEKDDSPGPNCDLTFTPKKAGKYTLEIVNKGPGVNTSTLNVEAGKKGSK